MLFAVLWALTYYTRKKYDEEREEIHSQVQDLRYTSQIKVIKELLKKKFGEGIEIEDSSQSNITLMYKNDLQERRTFIGGSTQETRFFARPRSESNIGEDFTVKVPTGIDKKKVEDLINKYVFYGVGYSIV